ncbi:MAG: DUF6591 domain-containing protein [Eubacteriales bacterium]
MTLKCKRCDADMTISEDGKFLKCPYCGAKELIDESDAVKIQKIRSQTYQEVEMGKLKLESERLKHEIEMDKITLEKDQIASFKKGKIGKALFIFAIISLITSFASFGGGSPFAGFIALVQAVLYGTAWLMGAHVIKTKRKGMHILLAVIGIILIIPFLAAVGGSENETNDIKTSSDNNSVYTSDLLDGTITSSLEEESENTEKVVEKSENTEKQETPESTADKTSSVMIDGMRKEFKDAVDSYEKFFDEYIAFMEKYENSDNALSMIADYTKFLTQYADMMEKMDALGDEDMNDVEAAYYIEVTGRIYQKLANAAR